MDAAQIYDVVSDFVTLRKRGVNYVGLCPFHDDKTPSFYVSPAKNLCKCFACGKGGNPVHFIMLHEQLSYPDALRFLAKKYHIEIQEREQTAEEKAAQTERDSLFVVNQFACDYFRHTLRDTDEGRNIGMAYLRSRGFRDDIIEKFHHREVPTGLLHREPRCLRQGGPGQRLPERLPRQDRPLLRDGRPPPARPILGPRHLPCPHAQRQGGGLRRTCAGRRHQGREGEVRQLARVGDLPQKQRTLWHLPGHSRLVGHRPDHPPNQADTPLHQQPHRAL